MNRRLLWKVSVTTTPEAEEAVSEWVVSAFDQPVASYIDAETGKTVVTAYLQKRPDWSRARRASLQSGLEQIRARGVRVGPGRISLARVRHQDWAESWKRHFRPIRIGSALLIKPSWSQQRSRDGRAVVVLDPGLSFGTGHHPTTAFCLRQLVARRSACQSQSFLDIGTGSGILAIAAAKLGFSPVDAFDLDPEAVRIASANARQNRVSGSIRLFQQDLARLSRRRPQKYSVICANLTSNLLVTEPERIWVRLQQPGGVLVVAGILDTEFAPVQRIYERAGLRLSVSQTQRHWRSGVFAWQR
jgi:ribosomal protein L11 methyltransferase